MASALVDNSYILSAGEYKQEFLFTNETGGYNNATGEWEGITSVPEYAFGSIQPVPREEFREMIDWIVGGARIKSAILIIAQADLIAAENGDPSSSIGSTVLYAGLTWKVVDVQDYSPHGHKECIAVRIDGQNNLEQP